MKPSLSSWRSDVNAEQSALSNSSSDDDEFLIPAWIRFGAVGLFAVVLGVMGMLFFTRSATEQMPPTLLDIEHSTIDPNSTVTHDPVEWDSARPVPSKAETKGLTVDNPAMPPHTLESTATPEPWATQLEQLNNELADLLSRQNAVNQQQERSISDLQQQLSAQALKIQQLEQHRLDLAKTLSKRRQRSIAKPLISTTAKPRQSKPKPVPFVLVGIDRWGDDRYAILRHKGQFYQKTRGQTFLGWRIHTIQANQQSVSVLDPAGRQHVLQSSQQSD